MVERFDYHHTMSESLGRYPEGQFVYYSDYAKLAEALRNIAEGNLGDEPWQANYSRIRQVARAALSKPAALPAEGKGESALVPPLTRPSYCKPHEFVLLASYCGDDTEGCTEQRPCAHCLAMCNIYGEDGMYLRQLGEFVGHPDATPSAPQPLEGAVKVDAVPARIEWRKRERTFPAVEEPWSVVDYHTGLLIQQHPEKYETRPLYALSAPSLSPAPQPVGEVTDDMVRKAGDVLLYQVNAPEQVIYAAARLAYPPDGEPANLLRGLRRHLRTAILGCNRCVAKARNQ